MPPGTRPSLPPEERDEPTPEGIPVGVSPALLRATHETTQATHALVVAQGPVLDSIASTGRDTATATIRMAALAEERASREQEDREARRKAAEREEEREAQRWQKVGTWFSDNWKFIALIALLVFYPRVAEQLQKMGLLPSLAQPVPVLAAPASAPTPVPVEPASGGEEPAP